ncbi:hypothetical protein FSP39_001718 [Pinctada imbricata]|uniref:Uncharacterized protein n=1 Tax=Pinctada imbricata TaxID=66713 RepID=A0AA88YG86_PINIB|nr:hypothetical protein FSP39_001718 [Pinctada imbricata]
MDSDSDLLQARKAVDSFNAEENGIQSTLDAMSKSINSKSLEAMKQKQLADVEKEVELLEKRISEIQKKQIQRLKRQRATKKRRTLESVNAEIQNVKNQVTQLVDLTGVEIVSYTTKENVEEGSVLREHQIKGMCSAVDFEVMFITEENLETHVACTMEMDISLEYKVAVDGLQSALNKLCQSKYPRCQTSIQDFFRLITDYSRWLDHRTKTFDYFYRTFPNLVSVKLNEEGNPYLVMQNPDVKYSPIFTVFWGFQVDEQLFHPKPDIKLEVDIPKALQDRDKEKVISQSPEKFQEMLVTLGVEHAIHIIVQLVQGR